MSFRVRFIGPETCSPFAFSQKSALSLVKSSRGGLEPSAPSTRAGWLLPGDMRLNVNAKEYYGISAEAIFFADVIHCILLYKHRQGTIERRRVVASRCHGIHF